MDRLSGHVVDVVHRDVLAGADHAGTGVGWGDHVRRPEYFGGGGDGVGDSRRGPKPGNDPRQSARLRLVFADHDRVSRIFRGVDDPKNRRAKRGAEVVAVFLAFWIILKWRSGGQFLSVVLALIVSLAVMACGFWRGDLPYIAHPVEGTRLAAINNLWIAPAWIFGFLCCPYLDLTFHAARQALPRTQSRIAFGLGFGVLFPLMLVFTVAYSGWLAIGFDRLKYPILAFILAAHLIVQSCLTCALHVQQISGVEKKLKLGQFFAFSGLLVIAVVLGIVDRGEFRYNGIALGEIIYRAFMGFYGLVVPAYAWLRICRPRRSMLRVWTVIAIAAPLYWLGFANEQMPFIVPGVIIVVLAKFLPEAQYPVSEC